MEKNIQVARDDFLALLKPFKNQKVCKPFPGEEAILTFSDCLLSMDFGGVCNECPTSGIESIQGRISDHLITAIIKVPPKKDPVILCVEEEKLRIGTTILKTKWQNPIPKRIEVPAESSLVVDLLCLRLEYSNKEIEESGYSKPVAHALEEYYTAIAKAQHYLDDLHVTQQDLHKFVDKFLKKRFKKQSQQTQG